MSQNGEKNRITNKKGQPFGPAFSQVLGAGKLLGYMLEWI